MLELADIVRAVGPEQCAKLAVLPSQKKALQDIVRCRTPALGGQLFRCDHCGAEQYSYHSCGNRHCPKCHGQQTQAWLEAQRQRLLPCGYYLLTFTVPSELRALAWDHQRAVYSLLLQCTAASVFQLCRDPQWLGAQPSVVAVLHTWTRALLYHPHVHLLVSAGGLSVDGQRWVEAKHPRFLVPVHALSHIFRAKIRDALQGRGWLSAVPQRVWQRSKKWVVHAQHAGRGQKVLDYLARYVFRVALSNSRLEGFEQGQVTFRYRDNRSQQLKRLCLPAVEFLSRFLRHVLPKGFAKVRHYGLDGSANHRRHEQARRLLKVEPPTVIEPAQVPQVEPDQVPNSAMGAARLACGWPRCPHCRVGHLVFIAELPRKIPP